MAATPQQRRAALIALMLTASAGGGYVAKDDLMAIGQRFCGPTPTAIIVGTELEATRENLEKFQRDGKPAMVRLSLGQAQGLMARWCDPDRTQIDDRVDAILTKGESK